MAKWNPTFAKNYMSMCPTCGKMFLLRRSRDFESKVNYCSRKCNVSNGTLHIAMCEICGVEFRYNSGSGTYDHENKSRKPRRFCSRKCSGDNLTKNGNGYFVKGYKHFSFKGKHAHEHISIAEMALGRKLTDNEVVHHINMDKSDNRNCNLLICTRAYHNAIHHKYAKRFAQLHLGAANG